MSSEIVKLRFSDGSELLAEVDGDETVRQGATPAALSGEPIIDFASALAKVRSAAEQLRHGLSGLEPPPKTCELTFGIKLSASAGVVLAKAGTEASFGIKLSWSRKE
jgi:hypothetical protein